MLFYPRYLYILLSVLMLWICFNFTVSDNEKISVLAVAEEIAPHRAEEGASACPNEDKTEFSESVSVPERSVSASAGEDKVQHQGPYPDMYVEYPDSFSNPQNTVYLTFDDGPTGLTDEYLAVLAEYGVKATFFVVGKDQDTETGRARLRRIYEEGHTIGVHCYLHDYDEIYASLEAYLADFYKAYCFVLEVTGEAPAIVRFPGGSSKMKAYGIRSEVLEEMKRRGFVCYDWTITTADTAPDASKEACIRNVVNNCASDRKNIVLAHEGKRMVLDALPDIIQKLRDKGFAFAALTPGAESSLF